MYLDKSIQNEDINDQYLDFDPGRARSYQYPNPDNESKNYIDSTYYDKKECYFDLGYQNLKNLQINRYPEFSYLRTLFVDHNNLTMLPDPNYLPHITSLNCSVNKLTAIPFYPKITSLNICHNLIKSIKQYKNSNLNYLDCSYNEEFVLDVYLPNCIHLYITDCGLEYIDLNLIPKLEYLDCGSNNLSSIIGGQKLKEINFINNKIQSLPNFPNLINMMADDNCITILQTFPNLESLNICYNQLVTIHDQPKCTKLFASHNQIKKIGQIPLVKIVDLNNNHLNEFIVPEKIEFLSIQFNPLVKFDIQQQVLSTIKEIQIDIDTYTNICQTILKNVQNACVQTSEPKLDSLINQLDSIFDKSMSRYIYKSFCMVNFTSREEMLKKISLKIYLKYFSKKLTIDKIIKTDEFKKLYHNITQFYYKTIIITLYFNGYF